MNTNEFKTSLSKLRPDEETKQRMLSNILAQKKTYKIHNRRFVPYVATAAAAVFLFAGGVLYHQNVNNIEDNKVAMKENVDLNEKLPNAADKNSDAAIPEKHAQTKTESKVEERENANTYSGSDVKKHTVKDSTGADIPVSGTGEKSDEPSFDKKEEEKVFGVKIAVNDVSNENADKGGVSSFAADVLIEENTDDAVGIASGATAKMIAETMGEDEYFSYLGHNFKDALYIPNGYSYCGFNDFYADRDNEGNLINDTADFLYAGESDSFFDIKTSKRDADGAMGKYSGYEKSNFGGNDVVITKDSDTYNAYFVSDGIFYNVSSYLVLKDEFIKIVKSLM